MPGTGVRKATACQGRRKILNVRTGGCRVDSSAENLPSSIVPAVASECRAIMYFTCSACCCNYGRTCTCQHGAFPQVLCIHGWLVAFGNFFGRFPTSQYLIHTIGSPVPL
eukprot:scpid24326/ scgid10061/ 